MNIFSTHFECIFTSSPLVSSVFFQGQLVILTLSNLQNPVSPGPTDWSVTTYLNTLASDARMVNLFHSFRVWFHIFSTRFECIVHIFSTRFESTFSIFSTRFECIFSIFSTRFECIFSGRKDQRPFPILYCSWSRSDQAEFFSGPSVLWEQGLRG